MSIDVAQSVRDRLRNRARDRNENFNFLLYRFAAERLLYRLSLSPYRDRFTLKAASLFSLWMAQPHRATNDLDLEGFGTYDTETLLNVFREICAIVTGDDGLVFAIDPHYGVID